MNQTFSEHPIKHVLLDNGYKLYDDGKNWRCQALYRGGRSQSLCVNKRNGWYFDFGSNEKGSPWKLAQLVSGRLHSFQRVEYNAEQNDKIPVMKIYPKECLKSLVPHFNLYIRRGISLDVLNEFEAGLAHGGKLKNRIVFPVYNQSGQIVGFSARWHQEETPDYIVPIPKWKNIPKSSSFLFPCHLSEKHIRQSETLILVESVGDVLAFYNAGIRNVLCTFGLNLSTKLFNYIIGLSPKRIIIALNNDEDKKKGPAAAEKIKAKLDGFFDNVQIAFPLLKDFGEMSPNQIRNWAAKLK